MASDGRPERSGPTHFDLARQLQATAAEARARRDPNTTAGLDAALTALRRSGAIEAALQLGELAPDFELPNAAGRWRSLAELTSSGAAVITFFRGAWCPYCDLTLHALQSLLPEIRRRGGQVAAISPQPREIAGAQSDRQRLSFDLLHDRGNRIGRLFGLAYEFPAAWITYYRSIGIEVSLINGTGRWELPLAATYVIGEDGTAAYASIEADPARRFDPPALLRSLRRLRAGD